MKRKKDRDGISCYARVSREPEGERASGSGAACVGPNESISTNPMFARERAKALASDRAYSEFKIQSRSILHQNIYNTTNVEKSPHGVYYNPHASATSNSKFKVQSKVISARDIYNITNVEKRPHGVYYNPYASATSNPLQSLNKMKEKGLLKKGSIKKRLPGYKIIQTFTIGFPNTIHNSKGKLRK